MVPLATRLGRALNPIDGKDYRKQGPAGAGTKPYTLPKPKQDMPPPGGFPAIRTKRFVGITTQIPSSIILGVTAAGMMIGMWRVGQFNIERRGWKQEKVDARRSLVPYLQAEEDLAFVAKESKKNELEAKVMAGVEGWKAGESVYNTSKVYAKPMVNDHTL